MDERNPAKARIWNMLALVGACYTRDDAVLPVKPEAGGNLGERVRDTVTKLLSDPLVTDEYLKLIGDMVYRVAKAAVWTDRMKSGRTPRPAREGPRQAPQHARGGPGGKYPARPAGPRNRPVGRPRR